MPISSTNLFHFYKKKNFLEDALTNGLWPRFCTEYGWLGKDISIPMICFCDIPLSRISFHMSKYGKYGIGVTKSWAKKYKITPVLYTTVQNDICDKLSKFIKNLENDKVSTYSKMPFEECLLYRTKRVTANDIEAQYYNTAKRPKFYNEREWRYIPDITEQVHLVLYKRPKKTNKVSYEEGNNRLSETTNSQRINVSAEDVRYLIIPESDRKDFISFLKIHFPTNSDEYISRIITIEQIKADF